MASNKQQKPETEVSSPEVEAILQTLDSQIKSSALELLAGSIGGNGTNNEQVDKFKVAMITENGYRKQVGEGINYFIRTSIGDYVFHVRLNRDPKDNFTITKVIGPKDFYDPIEFF